ncbi:unnamed protein product [Notodromas monacha]|uniref:Uncharacterized protein n=1 Tax=Notodromas monacha TaxID=399045 RepID=A0A7R9BXF4_9CRUS|nr:unnamed protein product [Notodromas monacha]CAG0922438.1 unnamed protein product [Notodromas monacha]
MNKAVLVFLVVAVSAVHGYAVNSHQGAAVEQQQYDARDAVRGIRGRGYEILKRAARDLFHTVSEERAKSQASWSQLYKSAYPEIEGRALNPLGSVGMNLAFGLGTLVLGLAGMSFGGSTVARSLKTAYDGIEWRSGLVAMTRDDFLERTFDWMDVKDATCKQRMICEVEQYAADQSTFKTLILKFLRQARNPDQKLQSSALMENANVPELVLESKTNLVALEFNPKDCNILAGGMDKGQVCWWDIRRGPVPVETTPVHVSHTEPVYSLTWINSKQGTEWFTAANDGKALWWDSRKLSEPTDVMLFDIRGTKAAAQIENLTCRGPLGASCLEYEHTIPTRFMRSHPKLCFMTCFGIRSGKVALCTRKAKNPAERILNVYGAHAGPVYAVQRNPSALKNFLTIGDWSAKIWAEDVRDSAIISTKAQPARLIDGCWNPTRPCTFYTANLNGVLDAWDILAYHSKPIFSLQVCDEGLQCIRVEESGHLLAAGSVEGNTYLIQVSESLNRMSKNERTLMTALLEREAHREKLLEQRVKEQRVRERSSGRVANNTPGTPGPNHEERFLMPMDHEAMEKAKKDYLSAVKAELEQRTLTEEQALAEIALLESDSRMPQTDDEKILLEATTINLPPGAHELMEIRREAEAILRARGISRGFSTVASSLCAPAIPDTDDEDDGEPIDPNNLITSRQELIDRRNAADKDSDNDDPGLIDR